MEEYAPAILFVVMALLAVMVVYRALSRGTGAPHPKSVKRGPRLEWENIDREPFALDRPVKLGREYTAEDKSKHYRFVDLTDNQFDPEPIASRDHALIKPVPAGHVIRDLGSSNSTYVDGTKIVGDVPLTEGSRILAGPYIFVYRTQEANELKGEMWDDYEIVKLLGRGGMSDVYEARLPKRGGAMRALKIPTDYIGENFIEKTQRISRERDFLRRLGKDPAAMRYILELQEDGVFADTGGRNRNKPFLALELVTGGDLRERMQQGRMTLAESDVRVVGSQVAAALGHVHLSNIVHCDVRPENILFCGDTKQPIRISQSKLIDFGISVDMRTTQPNPWGDERYMAPEHIQGGTLTGATDLYSFGCMLYELLSGRPPFEGDQEFVKNEHCKASSRPVPVIEVAEKSGNRVSKPMNDLVMKLLEKDAEARPGSALLVAEALSPRGAVQ